MSTMRYRQVAIEALGSALPSERIPTQLLEAKLKPLYSRIGIKPGLIQELTGVAERRMWPAGLGPADAAVKAAEDALSKSQLNKDDLGVVIFTGVSKDMLEPSLASLVHGALGLPPTCLNFDVANACLGFLSGMALVAAMVETGQIKAGLVVAGETSRPVTEATLGRLSQPSAGFAELKEELASLTLGSGAVAMVLAHQDLVSGPKRQLLGGFAAAASHQSHLCRGDMNQMRTDAPKLLAAGIELAETTWKGTKDTLQIDVDQVQAFCMHQVGKANHSGVIKTLGLPVERVPKLYPHLGNVGAASVPLALIEAEQQGLFGPGQTAMLMGIGSGLNCWMMGVRW